MKLIKTEHRYPIFFIGIMTILLTGFIGRYEHTWNIIGTAAVALGFLVAVLSVVLP
jgi:hypothetical protein